MNFEKVDGNSAPEGFACIWQGKWVGIITIETEKMWVHSSCHVFVVQVSCCGILNSLIFRKAWSMQAWIPVVYGAANRTNRSLWPLKWIATPLKRRPTPLKWRGIALKWIPTPLKWRPTPLKWWGIPLKWIQTPLKWRPTPLKWRGTSWNWRPTLRWSEAERNDL